VVLGSSSLIAAEDGRIYTTRNSQPSVALFPSQGGKFFLPFALPLFFFVALFPHFSTLWLGICNSKHAILIPISLNSPSGDTLWVRVPPYISLHMHIVPNVFLLCSTSQDLALAEGRTELSKSPDCALHIPVSHDRHRICFSFLLVHQAFWAWCKSGFLHRIRGCPQQSWSAEAQTPTSVQLLWAHRWCFL